MLPDNGGMVNQDGLRRNFLAIRDRLSAQDLEEKSRTIQTRLWQVEKFLACRTVMFYASIRSEVRTGAAIARGLAAGARVALPLSEPLSRRLSPYLVTNPDHDLRPGYYAIPEPDPDRTRPLAPEQLEAVIVPGSVFDLRGGRLGYGGGFYDRFLAREAPRALRVGLAFELQVVPAVLPLAPHDQLLDCLVTEDRTLFFANRG